MKDYRVRLLQDETYQVVTEDYDEDTDQYNFETEHQGSLADCEAFIKLKQGGYL